MNLFLLRGCPGAGKSEMAELLKSMNPNLVCISADDYFVVDGEYVFDASRIKDAHMYCKQQFMAALIKRDQIVIHNTFTQEWELDLYIKLAEANGYKVFSLIVENRHGNKSVHGVPDETIKKMKERFEVSL